MVSPLRRFIGPGLTGVGLFFINHLAVLHGWLAPPAGHVPLMVTNGTGTAVQFAWFNGFRTDLLLPAFQAPWSTRRAFFTPLKFLLGRISSLFQVETNSTYIVCHLLAYIMTSCALAFALKVFLASARERIAAIALAICAVPLASNAVLLYAVAGAVIGMAAKVIFPLMRSISCPGYFTMIAPGSINFCGTSLTLSIEAVTAVCGGISRAATSTVTMA